MGCGASKDPKIGVSDSIKPVKTNNSSSNNLSRSNNNKKELKNNSSYNDPRNLPDTKNVPAPLAFVISFDDNNANNEVRRPPPGRLRLEPINSNKHKLTKDELDDKMRAAEHNREKILAERAKSSGTKKRTPNHSNYSSDRNDSDLNFKDENNFAKKRGGGGSDARMNGDYERNDDNKQRLLKNRRIVQQPDDNDDLDINSKYNNRRDDDYYNDRRYK